MPSTLIPRFLHTCSSLCLEHTSDLLASPPCVPIPFPSSVWIRSQISQLLAPPGNCTSLGASLVAQTVNNIPAMRETWVQSLSREDPRRREWLPTPVFLPGESPGQRSLAGYSPGSHKESDITERLTLLLHPCLAYSHLR